MKIYKSRSHELLATITAAKLNETIVFFHFKDMEQIIYMDRDIALATSPVSVILSRTTGRVDQ